MVAAKDEAAGVGAQPWLTAPETRAVMAALEAAGGPDCARFVGGCVRNALMRRPVDDVDIATVLRPEAVIAAIEAAGLKAVPTGVEHGTVTAGSGGRPFEITTLRRDVETDGRRAVVAFTEDWSEDAARRDFRLNALYADAGGTVFDPVGCGIDDALAGRIVFVGIAGIGKLILAGPLVERADVLGVLVAEVLHEKLGRPRPVTVEAIQVDLRILSDI